MTGHQVYSTLHTNSAVGAIPRLIDLGLTPELMAGNLIGIIGQRLVRKLCPHCKVPFEADDETALALGMPADGPRTLYRAEGCLRCEYQGYRGRMALQEILCLDEELDDLIARHASTRDILKAARQKGYRTLADDAVRRIIAGSTSIEEAGRVVNLTALGSRMPDARAGAA